MKAEPLGDSALILRDLERPAYEVAAAIQSAALPGVVEAVASYDTVGVYFDSGLFEERSLHEIAFSAEGRAGSNHVVPVCYEMGEDIAEASDRMRLTIEEVIDLHTSIDYRCFAVGFCPGFPYLGYLPDALAGMPRRSAPRVRIEPGSVAITGRQTGIYPLERPGGWAIRGRTPLCIVDVDDGYFPIKAGDTLRFVPIGIDEFRSMKGNRL